MKQLSDERGFALVTVLLMMAVMLSMLTGYYMLTHIDMSTTRSSMSSIRGFYASEAGLNLRAEDIRDEFLGYNRPSGTPPDTDSLEPCEPGNMGSGDFRCIDYDLEHRTTQTFVEESPDNPFAIVVPRGEPYQNLNAQEYNYTVFATAFNQDDRKEAVLEMHFKSRLIPLFQFAVFYNKDLEILPGPTMTLEGPVHTNGDLYLGGNNSLDILGQVTTAKDLYRGRKNSDTCMPGAPSVIDPAVLQEIPACSGGRGLIEGYQLDPWNGMIRLGLDPVTVPPPETLDPVPGNTYWDLAEIRVMLNLNGATPEIEVYNADGTLNAADTATLAGCGAVSNSDTFYNNREATWIEMLDVDALETLNCLHNTNLLGGLGIDENSEGGLVWYLGVDGPNSAGINNYGVRVFNGADLESNSAGAPEIQGLTVVTNQAIYVQGNYNSIDKKPAAFLADSLNVLSNDWADANSTRALSNRVAASTTINAAFLGGTDSTGGVEGAGGQDAGQYNGGLENYPRFHERWSGRTLTYRGSFVSLNVPLHVDGPWIYGGSYYTAPNRDWGYDTDFDDAANLPPLSPRFVYLRQELFVRQFEL